MIVTVTNDEEENEWDYPCLVISEEGTLIIALGHGTFHYNFSGLNLAERRFSDCWDKDKFKLFKGTVTLRNE